MCLTKSRESGKDCKGVVAQKVRGYRTCDCIVTHASSFVFNSLIVEFNSGFDKATKILTDVAMEV